MTDHAIEVWNRACDYSVALTRPGDLALRRMLGFHGLVENGGLLHATEFEADDDEAHPVSVPAAYRAFGLEDAAQLIEHAAAEFARIERENHHALERAELRLDPEYTWDGDALTAAFQRELSRNPESFAHLDG